MMYGDMRTYANGRKKKYNAWSTKKRKPITEFTEYKPPVTYRRGDTSHIKSLDTTMYNCSKPEKKEYTGTLIKGISTMHKSNAVPILDAQEAKEHANMRR